MATQLRIPVGKRVFANIGEDGVGKTVCGATISKQFPTTFPPAKEVMITDTFWGCADLHALSSMRSCRVTVKDYFDIPAFLADKTLWRPEGITGKCQYTDAIRIMLVKMDAWLKIHPGGNLVIDTLSSLSAGLFCEFARNALGEGKKFSINLDPVNKRNVYGSLLASLEMLADLLMSMDFGTLLLLIHTKALVDMTEDSKTMQATKNQRKAGKALEDAMIIPDVTGNGLKYFKHHVILQLPIKAVRAPGAKVRQRYFLTNPATSEGLEIKNKFEGLLLDREPAHWINLIAKINNLKG